MAKRSLVNVPAGLTAEEIAVYRDLLTDEPPTGWGALDLRLVAMLSKLLAKAKPSSNEMRLILALRRSLDLQPATRRRPESVVASRARAEAERVVRERLASTGGDDDFLAKPDLDLDPGAFDRLVEDEMARRRAVRRLNREE